MTKVYTTVIDKVSGDVFSETMWDTYIRDNINNLIVPPACYVRRDANQAITTATVTAITWDVEVADNDTMHSTVSNQSRITPTTAGIYIFTCCTVWTSASGTGQRYTIWRKDNVGTSAGQWGRVNAPGQPTYTDGHNVSAMSDMNGSTSYMEVVVFQSSGVSQNIGLGSGASAVWVGRTS